MVVKNETIENHLENTKGLNNNQKNVLKHIGEQTWFKQYAKRSKENLKKITEKVKRGIKHGRYTYLSKELEPEDKDFIMPKPKKVTKKKVSKPKKKVTKAKPTVVRPKKKNITTPKETSDKNRQYTPETKKRVESARQKYPDASNYELRHGINSKASQEYRIRNNRPKKYEGRIIGK